jgi:branched-chain amino acid transport system ATP-binding protein
MSAEGLEIDDLYVRFGRARVIEGLTMRVAAGEIVGLAGRNGAGKSTTLRAISGVASRASGAIRLDGTELSKRPERVARQGVSHVPEGRGIFPNLTVDENIRLGILGRDNGDESLRERVEEAFPKVASLRQEKAGRLSGGEQQMVALLRGLICRPRILMVDEMSLGLSPLAVKTAIEVLASIGRTESIGVLIVDQNSRLLAEHCDRMYVLRDGKAEEWDNADDLANAYFE